MERILFIYKVAGVVFIVGLVILVAQGLPEALDKERAKKEAKRIRKASKLKAKGIQKQVKDFDKMLK